METDVRQLWAGIDWGTHSSKWWYSADTGGRRELEPVRLPGVIDSTIYRQGESLIIARERARTRSLSDLEDARLKRLLLTDPQGASFWDASREGIGISLGEAATLTIACLLGDMFRFSRDQGLSISSATQVNLRFSLPNWIGMDSGHLAARRRMFQASAVSVGLIKRLGWEGLPGVGKKISIAEWKGTIAKVRAMPELSRYLAVQSLTFESMVENEYALDGFRWRLAAESSAAGYLPLERLLEDVPKKATAQKHWVKLLVVDVGAGSTDAGYLISSRRIDGYELLMNYLPPARTLDYAGERLTEMLRDFYSRERNRDLGLEEAETMKVSAPESWIDQPFVQEWRAHIAKSVADYMFRVTDARLGETAIPGLKIVLTGGAGVVRGLDRSIRDAVADALARQGIAGAVANRTEVVQVPVRLIPDTVDAARRAVSLGAAQSEFAELVCRSGFTETVQRKIEGAGWL